LLISRNDSALAIPLLRPLAGDPHNASLAHAAQQMIEQAQAGAAASSAPAQGHSPAPRHPN
jgi:hypothetical protein